MNTLTNFKGTAMYDVARQVTSTKHPAKYSPVNCYNDKQMVKEGIRNRPLNKLYKHRTPHGLKQQVKILKKICTFKNKTLLKV